MQNTKKLACDLCVIGGGMAGICVAVTAARLGLKAVLVQDRNVLGGNASSEIGMWIRGAGWLFPKYREGGLIEELALDNMYYNPNMNFSVWDGVLYNKVRAEKNITLLLGATCIGAKQAERHIESVSVWGLQSYNNYEISAKYFADCSGDCILAEFTDAKTMQGRESKDMFGEAMALNEYDNSTMGNTCMIRLRAGKRQTAPPFPFERDIDALIDDRINIETNDWKCDNFWWLELGGDRDALRNADEINKEAVEHAFSAYRSIERRADNFDHSLDFVGFLAGKRETRRYVGDHILTANDIMNGTAFPDEIAYGGWSIDDHYPQGLYASKPNVHYFPQKPYAIPYRCIYSADIDNMFFAGRNISATHLALSSTRVMATCAMLGQAVGAACYVADKHAVTPREAGHNIAEIQQTLLRFDCYLLSTERRGVLSNTRERNIDANDDRIKLDVGERKSWRFERRYVSKVRIVFDSDLDRSYEPDIALKNFPMPCYCDNKSGISLPPDLIKTFVLRYKTAAGYKQIRINNNIHRLTFVDINDETDEIELTAESVHGGGDRCFLFSLDICE